MKIVIDFIKNFIHDSQWFQGLLDLRYILEVESYHLASELESCSSEIGVYLSDHANWPPPIFPDVPECSQLVFVPEWFDVMGSYWNCNSLGNEGKEEENVAIRAMDMKITLKKNLKIMKHLKIANS